MVITLRRFVARSSTVTFSGAGSRLSSGNNVPSGPARGECYSPPMFPRALVAAIIILSIARVVSTYDVFTQTTDEDVHIAAGYQWLTKQRFDVDLEHPPLARMFFAVDAKLTSPQISRAVHGENQGNEILHRNGEYVRNLSLARAGNLVFLLLALTTTGLWARRLFGTWPAIATVALLGSSPTILGHASLSTTDMASTATTITAAFALALWIEQPQWRQTAFLAIAVTLGLATKFSFIIYFPLATLALVVPEMMRRRAPLAIGIRSAQLAAVVTFAALSIWALYFFSVGTIREMRARAFPQMWPEAIADRYAAEPGYGWMRADLLERFWAYANHARETSGADVDIVDWAKASGYRSPAAGRRGDTLAGAPPIPRPPLKDRLLEPFRAASQWVAVDIRVPAPDFFAGVDLVRAHSRRGHPAFLLGEIRSSGWWYYFPVVFFFKSTIAFFVLSVVGVMLCIRARATPVALAPLLMLVPAMASSINIGVRHILPLYPFLAICAGYAIARIWAWRRAVAVALLAWHFVAGGIAHPDYLAYFNETAVRAERIALDSNLDWGQDLGRLADVVSRENIPHLFMAYFGRAEWRRHGIRGDDLPANTPVRGWIAISEMKISLLGADGTGKGYEWLKGRPYRRIGKSIRLYYVP
ncbi:MAG: glycosyltransferase family 39 protein [Thermoanaerobaculia bacterium]